MSWAFSLALLDWFVRLALTVRVIMRRIQVGESLAWIGILLLLPVGGIVLYLWFGERTIGRRRWRQIESVQPATSRWLQDIHPRAVHNWSVEQDQEKALSQMIRSTIGVPAIAGNQLQLYTSVVDVVQQLAEDIRSARQTCFLEFYIWEEGGITDSLIDVLIQAAQRGVDCRLLVDHLGSGRFLRSESARRLRRGGVRVVSALAVGLLRAFLQRFDLRLHRKIVVIDGQVAYAGSQNMADPALFKRHAEVGQWIDAMVRIKGEAAEALMATFLTDWQSETGEGFGALEIALASTPELPEQEAIVQVIPTGPTLQPLIAKEIVISALYAAKQQLILTTPYYVPDPSLQMAMVAAARRGVDVTLIVPQKLDSRLVALASNPFQEDLVAAGVRVMLYQRGFLHTKSITVDDRISFFGSLNLDLRSFHLNFEITLAIYSQIFTRRLRRLQQRYISESLQKTASGRLSAPRRLLENSVRLLAPLL